MLFRVWRPALPTHLYGDVRFVRPDDLNRTIRYYSSRRFTPGKFRYGWMPAHPTFFTYRHFFDDYGYYRTDYRIAADYELLIRFLYTYQLHTRYLAYDFIKMRTGGASTSSWRSNWVLKYFVKIFEYLNPDKR